MSKLYIRPQLRKKQEAENPDFNSDHAFPTLGVSIVKAWNTDKKSFKQKIEDLIAFEKMTEHEKELRAEEKKAMEGWEVLKLPMTRERLIAFNEKILTEVEEDDFYLAPITVQEDDNESVVSELISESIVSEVSSEEEE